MTGDAGSCLFVMPRREILQYSNNTDNTKEVNTTFTCLDVGVLSFSYR